MKQDRIYSLSELYSALVEEDRGGIRHNVPNARFGKWEINSLGFRGREVDFEKKEGERRIVCIGGSETFGFVESQGNEWPYQLGEMLRDRFPRVEVINASVVGLRLRNRKDYIERYVLPLKPDIMIIFHQRFLEYMRFSEYVRDSMETMRDKHLTSKVKGKKKYRRILLGLQGALERGFPEWVSTYISLWRLRRRIRKKERKYLLHKKPLDELPENIISEYSRDLKSFIRYLQENHIVSVLSTFPTLVTPLNKDQYKKILLGNRLIFSIELSENGFIDALQKINQVIKRIAKEKNLVFIDNDNLIPKTLEYFADNIHYTNKGAELIARNIYDHLNHYELIK